MTSEEYRKLKAAGRCPRCGIKLPEGYEFVKCVDCREEEHIQKRERREEDRARHKASSESLDSMSILAKAKGVSYGKLQQIETAERIKLRGDLLKGWGR